jgi:flagellar basal-body rod modification protein FlgD
VIDTQAVTLPGSTVSSTAAAATGSNKIGMNDFLKLLVTQLQNQDPLNPLDQNQFLSQTAQFTAVEQLQQINQSLAALKAATPSSGMTQAATLLGKTVTVAGQDVTFDGVNPVSLPFTVRGGAAQVQIEILDPQGNLMQTLSAPAGQPGDYTATWNGKDTTGTPLSPGLYHYRVSAASGTGGDAAAVVGQGAVTGFDLRGGVLRYQVGNVLVRPEDVTAVTQ